MKPGIYYGLISMRIGPTTVSNYFSQGIYESTKAALAGFEAAARLEAPDGATLENRVAYRIEDDNVRRAAASLGMSGS